MSQEDAAVALQVLLGLPTLLRATRVQRGLTLRAVEEKIGIGASELSRMENGLKTRQRVDTIVRILQWIVEDA